MSAKITARRSGMRRGGLGRVILALLSGGVALPLVAETVNVLRPVARSAVPDPD
ncbi:MAG TPA: lytic transglycosylase, partial [Sulfitobacter pontiacus]|nr:lytic transglycosylase [Sulfitobacter pontiacus]